MVSKRFVLIAQLVPLRAWCKLAPSGNLVSATKKSRALCEACFLVGDLALARFPDEDGHNNKLCTSHAKEYDTWYNKAPCRDCLDGCPTHAAYPDELGNPNRLCGLHSRIAESHKVRNPCRDCEETCKKEAHYPDENGTLNRLCGPHSQLVNSHEVQNPCRDCPDDNKTDACFPDENGKLNQLCSTHSKLVGSHRDLKPCKVCPDGNKSEAHFEDEHGNPRQLCAPHAKAIGTHVIRSPCRDCTVEPKTEAHYRDEHGNLNKLCAAHAYALGLIPKPVFSCSRIACEFWDKLEVELNIKLQHAHYSTDNVPSMSDEYNIPGTRYRVDAFDIENRVIYEYFGNHVHGFPENHPKFNGVSSLTHESNADMYKRTMDRMHVIYKLTGFTTKFVWDHEYIQIRKTGLSISSLLRTLSQ